MLGKVNGHILPLFCCLAMLCYLDRVNLAFAARQLNEDLGFSKAVYGLGSGAGLGGRCCLVFRLEQTLMPSVHRLRIWRQHGSSGVRATRQLSVASLHAGICSSACALHMQSRSP